MYGLGGQDFYSDLQFCDYFCGKLKGNPAEPPAIIQIFVDASNSWTYKQVIPWHHLVESQWEKQLSTNNRGQVAEYLGNTVSLQPTPGLLLEKLNSFHYSSIRSPNRSACNRPAGENVERSLLVRLLGLAPLSRLSGGKWQK